MKKNFTILGTGAFGIAIAVHLLNNGHEVIMYGIEDQQINDINLKHKSCFFEDQLPKALTATKDLKLAFKKAEYVVIAVPAKAVPILIKTINNHDFNQSFNWISVVKGFNEKARSPKELCMSYFIKQNLKPVLVKKIGTLYGPSIAKELFKLLPLCVNVFADDISYAEKLKNLFKSNYMHIETSTDMLGADICSTFKNMIAILAGMMEGLYNSDSGQASLITKCWHQTKAFALTLNAQPETFTSYCGIGDLILTATSTKSRNHMFGEAIGKLNSAEQALASFSLLAEGYYSCKVLYNVLKEELFQIIPFVGILYKVLYQNELPKDLIHRILEIK